MVNRGKDGRLDPNTPITKLFELSVGPYSLAYRRCLLTRGFVSLMSIVRQHDPDFRVCHISFESLLEIQRDAEDSGFATRWTSLDALRAQVKEGSVLVSPLMRETRGDLIHAYRCAVLFSVATGDGRGGVATIDISPARFGSLARIDRDPDLREVLANVFALALGGGISTVSKN
jgi:hypothetical protein